MSTQQIIESWENGVEPYRLNTKLTKEQRENIRFAIRWMDGDKLYRVHHVKGDAWKPVSSV